MFKKMIALTGAIVLSTSLMAGTIVPIRSTKLNAEFLNKIQKGEVENTVIEFLEGDRVPVNIKAQGDLFESADSNPVLVEVKKHFYVKIMKSDITMSFDGERFRPIKECLGGSLVVNASSSDGETQNFPVSVINIVFSAFVK